MNTTKPSWTDAPEWANYLFLDMLGYTPGWYWCENEVLVDDEMGIAVFRGKYKWAAEPTWITEERPQKPRWENIPEHLRFLAQEASGLWVAFENKPTRYGPFWQARGSWRTAHKTSAIDWEDSLEERL